jgi:tetratricopeptide (TPR) repeat protein
LGQYAIFPQGTFDRVVQGAVLVAIVLCLSACATTVQVNARFPARNVAASELRRIAVAEFWGPGGGEFGSALQAELANARFDGGNYFTVVDGGRAGIGDGRAAMTYGRSVGAQGVYSGRVEYANMHDEQYVGQEFACVVRDNDGNCKKTALVNVPCVKRTFDLAVLPTLTGTANGSVVYSARKSASTNTSWCRGGVQEVSDFALIDGARRNILTDIRLDVAPYNSVLQATIKEGKEGLQEDAAKLFDAAVAAAKKRDMGEACRLWQQVDKAQPNHVWTVYDLGVCAETNGDYAAAVASYQRAQSLSPKQDRDVSVALGRVQRLISAKSELDRQKAERDRVAAVQKQRADQAERQRVADDKAAKASAAAKHNALVAKYGAKTAAAIEAHQVAKGMGMDAVREAMGNPARSENIPPNIALWHYPSLEVGFTAGKVTSISH